MVSTFWIWFRIYLCSVGMIYKKSECTALLRWVITLAIVIKNANPECMKYQVFRTEWRHESRTEFLNDAKITQTYSRKEFQG